jgi:hypothetical protein
MMKLRAQFSFLQVAVVRLFGFLGSVLVHAAVAYGSVCIYTPMLLTPGRQSAQSQQSTLLSLQDPG